MHDYLARKQLEILPHTQCYFPNGTFDAQIVLQTGQIKPRMPKQRGSLVRVLPEIFSGWNQKRFGAYQQAVTQNIEPVIHIQNSLSSKPALMYGTVSLSSSSFVLKNTDVLTPRGAFDTLYSYGRLFHEMHFT